MWMWSSSASGYAAEVAVMWMWSSRASGYAAEVAVMWSEQGEGCQVLSE